MVRTFKFMVGDVVRMKEGDVLTTQVDHCNKVYKEHLTVYFRFWDGNRCCYVLNVGDDDICLISDEARLELEERPPMPEEEGSWTIVCKENLFLGSIFRINNRLVAAESLEKAVELFRSHPSHQNETIESIALQGRDLALIQNGKEE